MNKLISALSFICLLSCNNIQSTQEDLLLSEINKIFANSKGDIVFISDSDCSECTKKYLTKAHLRIKESKINGLILRNPKLKNREIDILKNETNDFVNWKETTNQNVMIAISKITKSRRGVYILSFNRENGIKVVNLLP